MNKYEAAIIMAYTGIIIGDFREFHAYAEKLLKRPIYTHQFSSPALMEEIKKLATPDFIELNAKLNLKG